MAKIFICRMRGVRRPRRRPPVTCNYTSNNKRASSKTRFTADLHGDVAKNTKKDDRVTVEIKAPTFPESIADGTVAAWHKQAGEAAKRDEVLVEIETDKVV